MTTHHRFTNREIADILAGVAARCKSSTPTVSASSPSRTPRKVSATWRATSTRSTRPANWSRSRAWAGPSPTPSTHCSSMAPTPSSTRWPRRCPGRGGHDAGARHGAEEGQTPLGGAGHRQCGVAARGRRRRPTARPQGFGAKSEEKILKGIELLDKRSAQGGDERTPIGVARPLALGMIAELQARVARRRHRTDRAWPAACAAGRRPSATWTSSASARQPSAVMAAFRSLPEVADVRRQRARPRAAWCWATGCRWICAWSNASTGARRCNTSPAARSTTSPLRELALKQGWSLNEYGLTATGDGAAPEGEQRFLPKKMNSTPFWGWTGCRPSCAKTAARCRRRGTMPCRADHDWRFAGRTARPHHLERRRRQRGRDGRAARARGYRYWNVSDHSVGLGIVQGVDGEKLRRQRVEIDAYNRHCAEQGIDFRLLQGSEVEILADGRWGCPTT
jgi:hypothetical protein